jgi:hypothetical protein
MQYHATVRRTFGPVAAAALLAAFASCANVGAPPEPRTSAGAPMDWGQNPPSPNDMGKHDITGPRPFEWWYFDGHLDSGETFVGVFLDPDFLTGKPGVTFSLYAPDWTKESRLATLTRDEMTSSREDMEITCPAGYVNRLGPDSYRVGWIFEGLRADFTLTTLAQGWLPEGGDGVNTDAMDFFWTVHEGRNRIEGTIARDGVTRSVAGEGYADHNWGKKPLAEIVRSWVWGRILAGSYTIVYADIIYRDPRITANPLYIAKEGGMIVGAGNPVFRESDFRVHPALQRPYPGRIEIEYANGGTEAHIDIRFLRLVEEVDMLTLSGMDAFSQWVARTFVARPTYFRAIAEYDGEIVEGGVPSPISGECLYEVMGFE